MQLPLDSSDLQPAEPPYLADLSTEAQQNNSWQLGIGLGLNVAASTFDDRMNLSLLCNSTLLQASLQVELAQPTCTDSECRWLSLAYLCESNYSGVRNQSRADTISPVMEAAAGFPFAIKVLIMVATAIVSCITVIGNLMVLISFVIERSLRQATNYFIVSLAVTDVLIGLFSMNFFSLYIALDYTWPIGELICDLWLALDFTVCLASQYTVFFITVDRFCSVKIATQYRIWRTDAKVAAMVLGSWFIPFAVFFTVILGWKSFYGRSRKETACEAEFTYNVWFTLILTIAYYWVTLVVMTVLYMEIYRVAAAMGNKNAEKRKQAMRLVSASENKRAPVDNDRADSSNNDPRQSQAGQRGGGADMDDDITSCSRDTCNTAQQPATRNGSPRKPLMSLKNARQSLLSKAKSSQKNKPLKVENKAGKALRTITFILGFFVACWTPYHVVILINGFYTLTTGDDSYYTNEHVYNFSYWLCYLNSPINPFCYAFVNAQFKKTFMRIMRFDFRVR